MRRLAELYRENAHPRESEAMRKGTKVDLQAWLCYLGADFDIRIFDVTHWEGFTRDRMSGAIDSHGRPVSGERKPVGPSRTAHALKTLRRACEIACGVKAGPERYLLKSNPTHPTRNFPLPEYPDPKRERYTDDEYRALLKHAPEVHNYLRPMLVLAHETGRRLGAICKLRWSDYDGGTLTWRADSDKLKRSWREIPITNEARAALDAHRRRHPGVGDALIFPSEVPKRSFVGRKTAWRWLKKAEALAGVERREHRGWHGFRRQFATEMKDAPVADVLTLGGWSDSRTLRRCYEGTDEDSMLEALSQRRRLRKAGQS